MEIAIRDLDGMLHIVKLEDVGPCYPDDDVIYFNGTPYRLSTARKLEENEEV